MHDGVCAARSRAVPDQEIVHRRARAEGSFVCQGWEAEGAPGGLTALDQTPIRDFDVTRSGAYVVSEAGVLRAYCASNAAQWEADICASINAVATTDFEEVEAAYGTVCARRDDNTLSCWLDAATEEVVASEVSAFAAGPSHLCVVRLNKTLECEEVRFADANAVDGPNSATDQTFQRVAVGLLETCAVRENGTIRCWGTPGQHIQEVNLDLSSDYVDILVGDKSVCAQHEAGHWSCFGADPDDILEQVESAGVPSHLSLEGGGPGACMIHARGDGSCFSSDPDRFTTLNSILAIPE